MHRRTASKRIVTDGRVLGEIDQVRHSLRLAQQTEKWNPQVGAESVGALERQLAELAERAADDSALVVVEAIPAEQFDEIARQHPPSKEQLERWREQAKVFPLAEMPEWNAQSMAPDLLAACMLAEVDFGDGEGPVSATAWSEAWWKGLSKGTQNQIWNLALSVQVAGADLPFYNAATASTTGGGDQSTIAANGEFLTRNS